MRSICFGFFSTCYFMGNCLDQSNFVHYCCHMRKLALDRFQMLWVDDLMCRLIVFRHVVVIFHMGSGNLKLVYFTPLLFSLNKRNMKQFAKLLSTFLCMNWLSWKGQFFSNLIQTVHTENIHCIHGTANYCRSFSMLLDCWSEVIIEEIGYLHAGEKQIQYLWINKHRSKASARGSLYWYLWF